ncbi:MAG: hypothetical protein H6712_09315 [Myxococcales bacterium]|nr:hypothetical protein [Myxococcales bacterium]MCB9714041.1 hypothetical protein [Myxococcales bacterium]
MELFERALADNLGTVIRFLNVVMRYPLHHELEWASQRMTAVPFESPPVGVSERAALLAHAHSVIPRRALEDADRVGLFTIARLTPSQMEEGIAELVRRQALLDLNDQERCANALLAVGTTPAEQAYVMSREFGLSEEESAGSVRRALDAFNSRRHALETSFRIEHRLLRMAEGGPSSDPAAVVLATTSLGQRLSTRMLNGSLGRDFSSTLDRLVAEGSPPPELDRSGALAVLAVLVRRHESRYLRDHLGSKPRRLLMLTYNSKDEAEVRLLHEAISRDRKRERLELWVDWEGIQRDRDPIVLTAAVILTIADGYVVSLGESGLGTFQRWEYQSAHALCEAQQHRRLAVAYLRTLPSDTALPLIEPSVEHIQIDLRREPNRAVRRLVDYLTG